MNSRIRLNGKDVEAKFKERYENLYSQCPVVVSASGNFYWCGEHVVLYGGPAMLQKIPARAHVGLERVPATAPKTSPLFAHWEYYRPLTERLVEEAIPMGARMRVEQLLSDLIRKMVGSEPDFRLVVHPLLEFPVGCGLNSSGAISAALAVGLHTMLGGIDPDDVTGWQTEEVCDLIKDKTFDKVFRTAWKIEAAIHGGTSSGAGAFVPFISTNYPVLYGTEKRRGTPGTKEDPYPPVSVGTEYRHINSISYWAERFKCIFELGPTDWPLDFGLLFSGTVKFTAETTDGLVRRHEERAEDTAAALTTTARHLISKDTPLPGFMEELDQDNSLTDKAAYDNWWDQVIGYGTLLVLETIWHLNRAFKMRSSLSVRRFIDSLNDFQRFLSVAGASSFDIDLLSMETHRFLKTKNPRAIAAVKVSGSGQSGDLVFAVPKRALVNRKDELIDWLDKCNPAESPNIDYLSWQDGIVGKGVQIELYIPYIYNPYVRPETLHVLLVESEQPSFVRSIEADEIEQVADDYNIVANLCNPERGKVFVGGQELNSEQLPSSKCTAKMLYQLAMYPAQPIESEKTRWLATSPSYALQSEFGSTILNPLKQVVREILGCELQIDVSSKYVDKGFKVTYHYSRSPSIAIIRPPGLDVSDL